MTAGRAFVLNARKGVSDDHTLGRSDSAPCLISFGRSEMQRREPEKVGQLSLVLRHVLRALIVNTVAALTRGTPRKRGISGHARAVGRATGCKRAN